MRWNERHPADTRTQSEYVLDCSMRIGVLCGLILGAGLLWWFVSNIVSDMRQQTIDNRRNLEQILKDHNTSIIEGRKAFEEMLAQHRAARLAHEAFWLRLSTK